MRWQLQEAKNKLSKVVHEAQVSGPQIITVRGEEAAVVISAQTYRQLTRQDDTLVSFLQNSPWADVELDLERSKDTGRSVDL